MITIYGSPRSSAGRCFWCLEELGVEYSHKTINFREKEHKSEAYLKINPNGKVPTLTDGDFAIWESMGINFYLAETYKPELLGSDHKVKGLVHQWSFWAISELQPPMIEAFIQMVFVPEERRSQEIIDKALEKLPALFTSLERALKENDYVAGEKFTLADINVASVVAVAREIRYGLDDYPHVKAWQNRLSQREAFKKYMALCEA